MQNIQASNLFSQCRLCGLSGHHEIDIWNEISQNTDIALSEKVFECIGVQVKRDDKITKMCKHCFDTVNEYFSFRDTCSTRNINYLLEKIGSAMKSRTDGDSFGANDDQNSIHEIIFDAGSSSGQSELGIANQLNDQTAYAVCISVTDTESDGDLQSPKTHNANSHRMTKNWRKFKQRKNRRFPVKCIGHGRCRNVFESRDAMIIHVNNYHAKGIKKTFECYLCKRILVNARSLRIHTNVIHSHRKHFKQKKGRFPFICESHHSCKYVFESRDAMLFHVSNYHAKGITRTFECYLCKRILHKGQYLRIHMNIIHSHRKQYTCPFEMCSRFFYDLDYLKSHIKYMHTKKIILPAGHKHLVNGRVLDKSSNRNFRFKCASIKCNDLFESWDAVMYHVGVYHALGIWKTYECYLCKMSIVNRFKLEQHMNTKHTHQKTYVCPFPFCSWIFYQIDGRRKHIDLYHPRKVVIEMDSNELKNERNIRCHSMVKCVFWRCRDLFFENHDAMEYHVANYHCKGTRISYECYLCKYQTATKQNFTKHLENVHNRRKCFV